MATISTLSDLLGYTSIACWLGAQFPQVMENIRRQSCEGLAFPFLVNWLLGDVSNLVGCILTHQLPFQTYLAVYFVFVDCSLVFQYFYYSWRSKPSLGRSRSLVAVAGARRLSRERGASRYRTLSAVAANVAATAALAAQQDERLDHRRRRQRHSEDHERSNRHAAEECTAGSDADDDGLTAVTASFHSEGGQEQGPKRVSWSIERHSRRGGSVDHPPGISRSSIPPPLRLTTTDSLMDPTGRGRSLQREADNFQAPPTSADRRSSRASQRATMVFLGAWAFFSIGTLTRRHFSSGSSPSIGSVLAVRGLHVPTSMPMIDSHALYDTSLDSLVTQQSSERVIGRIFAWLCTTLYLTSRLPQIWKNFARKSVEGLSMYLFVFAFFGNVFYVASILTSSKMNSPSGSTKFIKESIPYLLGSGGTLMFDITIVMQSFLYRPRPRRLRGLSHSSRLDEEETGLLTGESRVRPDTGSSLSRGRSSRTRTGTL